jgi:pSer/pThr/pTyr-binding forkhead associated (FHA) protein
MKSQGFVFHIQEQGMNGYDFFYHRDDPQEYYIGRVVGDVGFNIIQVQLQDKAASRNHCRIFRHPRSGWLVEDLNSTNGTWIQEDGVTSQPFKRITGPTPVDPYTTLRIGQTELTLRYLPVSKKQSHSQVADDRYPERISA